MHNDEQEKSTKEILKDMRFDILLIKLAIFGYVAFKIAWKIYVR